MSTGPKSPKGNSPKLPKKRSQSITFINNTDALLQQLSSATPESLTPTPSFTLGNSNANNNSSSRQPPRRGMSPSWSRSPGDHTPSGAPQDGMLTANTSTISFETNREAYPASVQRRNSVPAGGFSHSSSVALSGPKDDLARQLPTTSKSFSYFVHNASDESDSESVEMDPSVSGATHVYRGTTPTRSKTKDGKKMKKATLSPTRQSASKSPPPRSSPPPPTGEAANQTGYSLDSFRAFQNFPKGKVLKAKSVNANVPKNGRPQPKYNKRPEAELFQYAYSAHPMYASNGKAIPKARPTSPAGGGGGGGGVGLIAKGVAVGRTQQQQQQAATAPRKAATATGGGDFQATRHQRRSIIETYAAGLPPQSHRGGGGGGAHHANDEMDGEGNVGPLEDLAEQKEMAIELATVPAFSPALYKEMNVPFRLVKVEEEEDQEDDFITDTVHHNILMQQQNQQETANNPLFNYLSNYKMEVPSGQENEQGSVEGGGGGGKTVRFATFGATEPESLPGVSTTAPPSTTTVPQTDNPLGLVPSSSWTPPLSASMRDNPLGGASVTNNPGGTPIMEMMPLVSSNQPTPLQPSLGAPVISTTFNDYNMIGQASTTLPPPESTSHTSSNPFGLLGASTTTAMPGVLPLPTSSTTTETPLPAVGDSPGQQRPKMDSSAVELDVTLRPDQMQTLPGTTTAPAGATPPPAADPFSTPLPLKKEELKLTEEEKEELEFIRHLYMAKKSAEKFGDRGARAIPDHVLFASKRNMQWQLQTLKERHMEQYARLSDAQKTLFDEAAQMRLYHNLLDEKTGVDYQSIVEDVLYPERAAERLQDLYAQFISPIVENEMGRKRPNDASTRARMAQRMKQRKATVASQAVLLRDPVKLLACQHLSYEDTGARNRSILLANANASISRHDMLNMMGSVLRQVPPSGATFCELSYAAKVLLSAVLYIRALGGFPTLLRVQPLTDLSPVIDKENCIELVFWNTHEMPPDAGAAAAAAPPPPSVPAPTVDGSGADPQLAVPIRSPSMVGSALTRALSSVMTRNASMSNPRGTLLHPPGSSVLDTSNFLNSPGTSASHSSLLAHPPLVVSPRRTSTNSGEPEVVNAGSERLPGPAVPRVDTSVSKCVRVSSASLHKPTTEKEESVLHRSLHRSTGATSTPPPQTFASVRDSIVGGLAAGGGTSSSSNGGGGAPKEPPCPPTGKGRSRIREVKDEMCVVVRALVAQKSTVYRFGQEEIVHVLPPLPRMDEYIQQQAAQDVEEQEPRGAQGGDPLLRALSGESQAAKRRAAEAKQRSIQERNRRLVARKMVNLDGKGTPLFDDYGDLAVAFLLSGGASELSGVLPDVMELEALRYKLFTLQGYNTKDPHGVNRERQDSGSAATTPTPQGRSMAEAGGTSMVGGSVLDSMHRSSSQRRSTFEAELFNRYGYSSAQNDAEARAAQQLQRARREEIAHAKRKAVFPLYRASSVSERTLQEYCLLERAKARARRARLLQEGAKLEEEDDEDDVAAGALFGAGSRSVSNASVDATLQKNMNLREAEKELLRFRPLNLNGFYSEILEAVQLALDEQVR